MAKRPWKYGQNQFLRVSGSRRRLLLRVSRDHTAKLLSHVGSPPDSVLQTCLDRTLPLEDAYEMAIIQWEIVSGTRKGQTDVFEELLAELSGERIRVWDGLTTSVVCTAPSVKRICVTSIGSTLPSPGISRMNVTVVGLVCSHLGCR